MPAPLRIITISRLLGAGGSSLAAALGDRLGWRVLDRALVAEVAQRLQRPEADIQAVDEQALGPWERAAAFASAAFPEMPIPPLEAYLDTAVVATVEAVVREAADSGPVIVVGHGAQCILRNRTDALHLRLVAPFGQRVAVAARRLNLNDEAARQHVRKADEDRRAYLRQVHGIDGDDPLLYDLVINTRRLAIPDAADLVVHLVETRSR